MTRSLLARHHHQDHLQRSPSYLGTPARREPEATVATGRNGGIWARTGTALWSARPRMPSWQGLVSGGLAGAQFTEVVHAGAGDGRAGSRDRDREHPGRGRPRGQRRAATAAVAARRVPTARAASERGRTGRLARSPSAAATRRARERTSRSQTLTATGRIVTGPYRAIGQHPA